MPRTSRSIARATALLLALCAAVLAASPAHAAQLPRREISALRHLPPRLRRSPRRHLPRKMQHQAPSTATGLSPTSATTYNHQLWTLTQQKGPCLGLGGTASSKYLYSTCNPKGSKNVWEVFKTKTGRYVLKSFGTYQSWGQHKRLTFNGPHGRGRPQLGACSHTSTDEQIYK